MSFVRPEARAALWRWREVLAGLALAAAGAPLLFRFGLWVAFGAVLVGLGAILVVTGAQRGRFRGRAGGPGVVILDEGRVHYLGPLTGGSVALRDLAELAYDPGAHPASWMLRETGAPPLVIPVNAEGVEVLFDAFASLPGLSAERVLAALERAETHSVLWQAPHRRLD